MTTNATNKSMADMFAPPRGDSGLPYLPETSGPKRTFNRFEAGDETKFNTDMFAGVTRAPAVSAGLGH